MRFKTPLETKDEYIHDLHHEIEEHERGVKECEVYGERWLNGTWRPIARSR